MSIQVERQECVHGVVTTLRSERDQRCQQRCAQQAAGKDAHEVGWRLDAPAFEYFGLGHVPLDPDGEESGKNADKKHGPPRVWLGQKLEEECVEDCCDAPSDGPSCLRGADGAAAEFAADTLADEH